MTTKTNCDCVSQVSTKPKSKDKIVWCDRGWLPFHYGYCPSEKAWNANLKRLGIENVPYPKAAGNTTVFVGPSGDLCIIVTVNSDRVPDDAGLMGLLVHEAVHVKQHVLKDIGEHSPSSEFEAYTVQAIFMCLLDAYSSCHRGSK